MEIGTTTIFQGPSIYARTPVIRLEMKGLQKSDLKRFDRTLLDNLFDHLPGLEAHLEACDHSCIGEMQNGGSPQHLAHLFEHICVELQTLAGSVVACARTDTNDSSEKFEAVVPHEESRVCMRAATLACEMINGLLGTADADSEASAEDTDDFTSQLERFIHRAARHMLPLADRTVMREARNRGIPVARLVGRLQILGHGRYQQRLSASHTSLTDSVSVENASNKEYSRVVLGELGLPVPQYARVRRSRAAVAAAKEIGFPVVVKPNHGKMGKAVSVGMKNPREVRAAYKLARQYGTTVLIEQLIEGDDYRMLVINGKLVGATKRVPAHVIGDGQQSITDLIEEVNANPQRGTGPYLPFTKIKLDGVVDQRLAELGYTLESIPTKDETVYLRRNANTSTGGIAIDVTDDVHPENRAIAERAAKAIGLDIAGVDILTRDISRPMLKDNGGICEINSRPNLLIHIYPNEGKSHDVTGPIIDMLFPNGDNGRIKIIAVTGTEADNRRSTAELVAKMLTDRGHQVGLATGGSVYIDGATIGETKFSAPEATRAILLDPEVDVAVLEATPDDIIKFGLGFDACNVCAIVGSDGPANDSLGETDAVSASEAIRVIVQIADEAILVNDEIDVSAARICNFISPAPDLEQKIAADSTLVGRSIRNVVVGMSAKLTSRGNGQRRDT